MPVKSESMAAPQGSWTVPSTQGMRPRPATIHEGFSYCVGEAYEGLPSWDPSSVGMQHTPTEALSRPISVHQDLYPMTTLDNSELLGSRLHCHMANCASRQLDTETVRRQLGDARD